MNVFTSLTVLVVTKIHHSISEFVLGKLLHHLWIIELVHVWHSVLHQHIVILLLLLRHVLLHLLWNFIIHILWRTIILRKILLLTIKLLNVLGLLLEIILLKLLRILLTLQKLHLLEELLLLVIHVIVHLWHLHLLLSIRILLQIWHHLLLITHIIHVWLLQILRILVHLVLCLHKLHHLLEHRRHHLVS